MDQNLLTPLPNLLTLKETCKVLKCHPNTLRQWDKKGILPAVRFGIRKDRHYQKKDILNLIKDSKKEETLKKFPPETSIYKQEKHQEIPLFSSKVSAGFPFPAESHVESYLDLNEHLITHPAATFFVKARGNSMIQAGIYPGDLLIVNKALKASNNSIIIALLDGEFTVKRMCQKQGKLFLYPENPVFSSIEITEEMSFEVWGVVTHVIHSCKKI